MTNGRLLAMLSMTLAAVAVSARQPAHRHGGPVLFVVEAAAGNVRPASTSTGTATGAFTVDPARKVVAYELTYHGLVNGPPRSIALHNFGAGANGERVLPICGPNASQTCPAAPSGTLTGTWDADAKGAATLDPKLLGEFASGRVYLEIVGGAGAAEIRGQLEPNSAMVPVKNYVAHLASTRGGNGTGTAVLSETHFADGRVAVFYRLTVAGTEGTPRAASLTGVPPGAAGKGPSAFSSANALPQSRSLSAPTATAGGTLTGSYQSSAQRSSGPLPTRMADAAKGEVGITVSTSRFPGGELYGTFKPVN